MCSWVPIKEVGIWFERETTDPDSNKKVEFELGRKTANSEFPGI